MNIRTAPFLRSYVKLAFVVAFTICRFLWSGQLANAADNEKPALSYEDAISQCGLSRELADMKLAVYLYIPDDLPPSDVPMIIRVRQLCLPLQGP